MLKIPEGQTPIEVADLIKDVIKDKIVCDIGCGGGSFMRALNQYAKKVYGIEEEKEWYQHAIDNGFEIMAENVFSFPLPPADVYYCWNKNAMGIFMKAQYEKAKGIFIFGHTVRKTLLDFIQTLNPETREVNGFKVFIVNL